MHFLSIVQFHGSVFVKIPMWFSQMLQHTILFMLKKWKSAANKEKSFGALLTDLSKAFDCLSHELLLAKRHSYGFSIATSRLIHGYLTNRRQTTKINASFSSWGEIVSGCTTRVYSRTFVVQHFSVWSFFYNVGN